MYEMHGALHGARSACTLEKREPDFTLQKIIPMDTVISTAHLSKGNHSQIALRNWYGLRRLAPRRRRKSEKQESPH